MLQVAAGFPLQDSALYRIGLAEVATVLLLAMVLIVGASQCPHVCC